MPRCMPSVGFIATARTRFSPRCCCTSQTTSTVSLATMVADDAHGVVDRRQLAALELDVHDRTDDLDDFADVLTAVAIVSCSLVALSGLADPAVRRPPAVIADSPYR